MPADYTFDGPAFECGICAEDFDAHTPYVDVPPSGDKVCQDCYRRDIRRKFIA
jgi:hypothetical protein